jgi:hypothetical protein
MNEVRDRLIQRASEFAPSEHAYEVVLRKADRKRVTRRISAMVTAAVISCFVFAGLWEASRAPAVPLVSPTISQRPTPTSQGPTPTEIVPHDGLEIARTTSANGWVVLPDGFGIWVAGPGTLTRIDPETGDVRVTAHGGWDYDFVHLAQGGDGTILIASGTELLRLDGGSGTVIAKLDLSSLGYIDSVLSWKGTWVTASAEDGGQTLARVDLDTGRVVQRIDGIGQGIHELAHADGYLFVGSREYQGPALLRIDPGTAEVTSLRTAPAGASIAGVGSQLWITRGTAFEVPVDVVQCINAETLRSCGEVNLPSTPSEVAADGRDLWVLSGRSSGGSDRAQPAHVTVLDGTTGEVLAGPLSLPGNPSSIVAFGGRAWVGYYNSGTVIEVDLCKPGTCSSPPS